MSEVHPVGRCMETASGRFFDYDAPKFDVEDMAFHLSNINRYTGAVGGYSVAEHCVLVSWLAKDAFEGLMHDGLEAYLQDLNSPMKRRPELAGYKALETRLWEPYAKHFGLAAELSADTHWADNAAAYIEADVLLKSGGRHWPEYTAHAHLLGTHEIHCWSAPRARHEFLLRYDQLTKRRALAHG